MLNLAFAKRKLLTPLRAFITGKRSTPGDASMQHTVSDFPMDLVDHFQRLDDGPLLQILSHLSTPKDLALAMFVCKRWRVIGIEGRLWRNMCLNLHGVADPALAMVTKVEDLGSDWSLFGTSQQDGSDGQARHLSAGCSSGSSRQNVLAVSGNMDAELGDGSSDRAKCFQMAAESRVFCQLACELVSQPKPYNCIQRAIRASSTDNYPEEGIDKTLQPSPNWPNGSTPSYWSSKGKEDPLAPETLTYGLETPVCLVHEILVRPFQAYFQTGKPIYSARSVRFRFGYRVPRTPQQQGRAEPAYLTRDSILTFLEAGPEEDYVWTHESPVFPMQKLNALQRFVLPQPVLCIGGVVQVELLERIQTQEVDELFYICICHVRACGRPLPQFDYEFNPDGKTITLKLLPPTPSLGPISAGLRQDEVRRRVRNRRRPGPPPTAADSDAAAADETDLGRRVRELRDRAAVDDEALAVLNWLMADVQQWPPRGVLAQMLQNVMRREGRASVANQERRPLEDDDDSHEDPDPFWDMNDRQD